MASSNRHWPSLFKSKPCNTHHQWQHDFNTSSLLSSSSQKTPYSSGIGSEERTPEPKPRWNPKPEQIRILEAIFNSGMVNPPRDEIRKIRVQLQEYGQVGDANVFYWFQNRKSRSKHKQRQLQSRQQSRPVSTTAASTPNVGALTAASSSSASSDPSNSSGCSDKTLQSSKSAASGSNVVDMSNSPTNSVNQTYFHTTQGDQFSGEPFFFHTPANQGAAYSLPSAADLSLSTFAGITSTADHQGLGLISRPCLWNDLLCQEACKTTTTSGEPPESKGKKHHLQYHNIYGVTAAAATVTTAVNITFPSATAALAAAVAYSPASSTTTTTTATKPGPFGDTLQAPPCHCVDAEAGAAGGGPSRLVVFINEVAFELAAGPLNVREAFGVEAVLLHSSGLPVLVDEWGVTLQPLQHGASYYVV